MRKFYVSLLIMSLLFYIMYQGDLSFFTLAFVLLLPAVMFVLLAAGSLFVKITVSCDSGAVEKGSPAIIKLRIRNRSPLPVTACRVKLVCRAYSPFENGSEIKCVAEAAVGGRSEETLSLSVSPEHCGMISVRIKSVTLNDPLHLTFIPKKVGFSKTAAVLPRVFPLEAEIGRSYAHDPESTVLSKEKAGDDPSEIFMLREYRDGDRHNLIHWKLSSRSESFIVKELSMPVGSKILIIADTGGCGNAGAADRIFEAAASLSCFLARNETAHTLLLPENDMTLHTAEIKDEESFYSGFISLAQSVSKTELERSAANVMELSDRTFITKGGFSKIIAVSESDGEAYAEELAVLCGTARPSVVCTSPDAGGSDEPEGSSADFIYADAEKLSRFCGELFI